MPSDGSPANAVCLVVKGEEASLFWPLQVMVNAFTSIVQF